MFVYDPRLKQREAPRPIDLTDQQARELAAGGTIRVKPLAGGAQPRVGFPLYGREAFATVDLNPEEAAARKASDPRLRFRILGLGQYQPMRISFRATEGGRGPWRPAREMTLALTRLHLVVVEVNAWRWSIGPRPAVDPFAQVPTATPALDPNR